jgi:hypothetical protein
MLRRRRFWLAPRALRWAFFARPPMVCPFSCPFEPVRRGGNLLLIRAPQGTVIARQLWGGTNPPAEALQPLAGPLLDC